MDSAKELFDAQTWGWKSLNERFEIVDCELQGVSNTILQHYQEVGCDRDPLMRFAIEHHTPVHEQLILTSEQWQRSLIYQHVFSRYNIEHIAIAPIVGNGRLLGKIYVARTISKPFTTQDLVKLSALSTHLSVCLATVRSSALESPFVQYLTKREQQIANLIAHGLKTPELSTKLGITQNLVKQALKRIFVKLEVSTRAEMVAKLRTIRDR